MSVHTLQTASLSNEYIRIEFLTGGALRLVGLYYGDQPGNLLSLSPETMLPLGDTGYPLIGGHRLWASPEEPGWSYGAEGDIPLEVETAPNQVRLSQQQAEAANLRKEMLLTLEEDSPRLTIQHRLLNTSDKPVTAAPWALTVLPTGGVILLPFPRSESSSPFLPERNLVFWPYTTPENLNMRYLQDGVLLPTTGRTGPSKIGTYLKAGWCGCCFDGSLFLKKSVPEKHPVQTYPDFGSSCEVYMAASFLELETLGPIVEIFPGAAAVHTEIWDLTDDMSKDPDLAPYQKSVKAFFDL